MAKRRSYIGPVCDVGHIRDSLPDDQVSLLTKALGKPPSPASLAKLGWLLSGVRIRHENEARWPTAAQIERIAGPLARQSMALSRTLIALNNLEDPAASQVRIALEAALDKRQMRFSMIPHFLKNLAEEAQLVPGKILQPAAKGAEPKYELLQAVILALADLYESETGSNPTAYYDPIKERMSGRFLTFARQSVTIFGLRVPKPANAGAFAHLVKTTLAKRRKNKVNKSRPGIPN